MRKLERKGYANLVYRSVEELNLINRAEVKYFFGTKRSDQVYVAAAKVGGIYVNNTYPVEFIYDNLMVYKNLIHQVFMSGVKNSFFRSSCIYKN